MLTNRGIDDQEVKDMLIQYQITQEQVTDTLGGQFSHEEVAIHMAELYFDANYQEYALESLEEMLDLGPNDELYNRIEAARQRMVDRME